MREPERPNSHLRIFTGEPANVQESEILSPLVRIPDYLSQWTGTSLVLMGRGSG